MLSAKSTRSESRNGTLQLQALSHRYRVAIAQQGVVHVAAQFQSAAVGKAQIADDNPLLRLAQGLAALRAEAHAA